MFGIPATSTHEADLTLPYFFPAKFELGCTARRAGKLKNNWYRVVEQLVLLCSLYKATLINEPDFILQNCFWFISAYDLFLCQHALEAVQAGCGIIDMIS